MRESATAWRSRSGRPLSGDGTVPEDHRRPGPSSQRTARGPRRGPSFPVIHPRARSAPTAPRRPPGRPDRSGRIAVGAAVDGQLSTQGVWVKDAVREPSLTGAACGRTGATGAWRGAPDRRGGRLPPRSGARGGTRRAHRPSRSDRGHLAPVHGPWACAGNTGPLLHAVRPLQGTTRRAAAAPKRTRTTAGRGGGPPGPWRTSPSPTPRPLPPDGDDAGGGPGRSTPFPEPPAHGAPRRAFPTGAGLDAPAHTQHLRAAFLVVKGARSTSGPSGGLLFQD